ncbi:MAG: helix-turn-helix domain-containing protein [Natronomonas sp.]|uniref:helix-turn-helix domain-containing protein n=1 Tax=Natronomonas sp. TaxID=2184060 RepID=UPI0028709585|nr:helix-turn-helix domain-containing protein [Natronomonas sp.]MDR9381841.1 helix-turn-helix domain-containing protein [Natronomonas sp.]MDR9430269.1 helix-turn-helix domain-containing protein [Natronomonas sp.]
MEPDPDPSRFRDLMLDSEPGFEEVLRCVFGIQDHEARLYLELLNAPDSTVAELAETVDRDRSNVNRGLTTLMEKHLVDRRRRLLDSGGHVYQYRATAPEEARELMHETLDEWAAYVHERIDEFP